MTPDAPTAIIQPKRPDRRMPILVLHNNYDDWNNRLREHVGDRLRLEIPSGVKLSDLADFSQRSWRLVFMSSIRAVEDQRLPLEALEHWFASPHTKPGKPPVVILSRMPSVIEAQDALLAGAVWYSEMPWDKDYMEMTLQRSFQEARDFRKRNRI